MAGEISRRALGLGVGAAALLAGEAEAARPRYRRIAVEEAFILPEIRQALSDLVGGVPSMRSGPIAGPFMPNLLDLGERRLAQMDEAGIDVQLLSLTSPGVQNFSIEQGIDLARLANDRLAEAIAAHPTRFAGLAAIPPQAPADAARELERAVRTLGLKGAIINSSTQGEYLDDPKFSPIFEAAQALDAPIYLHPREPSPRMGDAIIMPGFTVGWGYGVETGTHALRLIAGGVFDRYPRVRIVLGHMGETLPMLLGRLDNRYLWETSLFNAPRLQRLPSEYIRDNFLITTSGMNFKRPLEMTIAELGIDNVLFAADYPMEDQGEAVRAIETMGLSTATKRKLFETNAVRVFKL